MVRPLGRYTRNRLKLLLRRITGHQVTKPPPWFYHLEKKSWRFCRSWMKSFIRIRNTWFNIWRWDLGTPEASLRGTAIELNPENPRNVADIARLVYLAYPTASQNIRVSWNKGRELSRGKYAECDRNLPLSSLLSRSFSTSFENFVPCFQELAPSAFVGLKDCDTWCPRLRFGVWGGKTTVARICTRTRNKNLYTKVRETLWKSRPLNYSIRVESAIGDLAKGVNGNVD